MAGAMNADQGNFSGIYFLQVFTLADGDEPVLGAMNNINMTFHLGNPMICP